jgi:hypothetical protein
MQTLVKLASQATSNRRKSSIGAWHQLGEMHANLGPWHGRPGHANLGKASLSSHIEPQKILNRCLAPIRGNACKNPNRWVAPIGETMQTLLKLAFQAAQSVAGTN